MDAIYRFWEICEEAKVAHRKSNYHQPALDKYGVKLLELIEQNKQLRSDFEKTFLELYESDRDLPWELIPFCMHTLKWTSLKRAFESRLKQSRVHSRLRSEPIIEDILNSFNEEWEDKDLHPHYSKT